MDTPQKSIIRYRIVLFIMAFMIEGGMIYYFHTPKNSIELYQDLSFAADFEEAQKLSLKGYEEHFKKKDFDYINSPDHSANSIGQFTLFEYDDKSYIIKTSPGTTKFKVLAVEELPADIRDYFVGMSE
ncbi:hypothetical protein [Bacillus sp. UMB0728]|uniref:hypothetical protein n=2 Tax=Bacillus TaxID=1386 RepID=UPI0021533D01|nr:hypothetical protein [Bacillus sp. UMB0728]